jgi:hypothetical protein
MFHKSTLLFLFALTLAPMAWAQTKISGTLQCGKPDPSYSIPVGDQPGHMYGLQKGKCTWTGLEIAGVQAKDYESTGVANFRGTHAKTQGDGFATLSNGDKFFTSDQGTLTMMKEGGYTEQGTWSFTGGTGKIKGIKGKGTFKSKATADGTGTVEVEGEYQLPLTK